MKIVDSFTGENRFLSNFASCMVRMDLVYYRTVEHAYQASKTLDETERGMILNLSTAGKAKKVGRRVTLRSDWDEVKVDIMRDLLQQKFSLSPFKEQLKSLSDTYIIEGNTWNDTFWGVCRGRGKNILGNLIMEIRDTL